MKSLIQLGFTSTVLFNTQKALSEPFGSFVLCFPILRIKIITEIITVFHRNVLIVRILIYMIRKSSRW